MKILKASLALIAFFALLLPCVHAGEHHHETSGPLEVCGVDHTECHSCSDESCVKSTQILPVQGVSIVEIPIRQVQLITIFSTERPPSVAPVRFSGTLQRLQTVQLLI